jgi:hypothetical protein
MIDMPRHGFMIAIGLPHGGQGSQDEDNFNREHDDGDGDLVTEAICSIVHSLHEGGPSAVRDLRLFTSALEDLCQTHMDKDYAGLEEAATNASEALRNLISD